MVSAVLLILQALNIKFDIMYINEVATAVLGLLVVIGIVNDPTKSTKTETKVNADNSKENGKNKSSVGAEQNIPIEKKDETIMDNSETNFQDVVTKIKEDLENTQAKETLKAIEIKEELGNIPDEELKNFETKKIFELNQIKEDFKAEILKLFKEIIEGQNKETEQPQKEEPQCDTLENALIESDEKVENQEEILTFNIVNN